MIITHISYCQQTKKSAFLMEKEILGTWQRNDSLVGNDLMQNFQFFANRTFVLNVGNGGDDVRNIVKLKGTYRIEKDKLFFTIKSRVIINGPIIMSDAGLSLNLFEIEVKETKEIPEVDPREIVDPAYITFFNKSYIKINNEKYFKVKVE